ncbi:MAG: peptidoglycan DD-metalloendopeptidase family protein [Lachnospiraceae bacterium]|nr:peptidoglycan DD-metalloendopeptidase family protein [Lachnospiraceae bacterium]
MHLSCHYKRLRIRRLTVAVIVAAIGLFFVPVFTRYIKPENNMFTVSVNGTYVGTTSSVEAAKHCYLEARRNVNALTDNLTFIDAAYSFEGKAVDWGRVDSDKDVILNMENILRQSVISDLSNAFEVKINGYIIDLASEEEVLKMLNASIEKYDENRIYNVVLEPDANRELPVLSASLSTGEEIAAIEEVQKTGSLMAGIDLTCELIAQEAEPEIEKRPEDYELGLISMKFGDKVEVAEVYIDPKDLTPLDSAIEEVTKEEAKSDIYKVVSGDTLSGIAIKVDVPMEDLIAMNDFLEDQNSMIRPDDEIIYSVPEPKLSIVRTQRMYYEETYDLPVVVHERDDWYTSDVEVLVQPSAGFHKVVSDIVFENSREVSVTEIAEDVTFAPVAKEIMRGTKIPPTYIKPIYGGRMTSGFGPRRRPTKGASSYHKGIDWATPVGTAVYASCGGTVAKAGWGSGYGYVVYINHPDGRQTRYGHLSKVLVSAGQTVSQGQKIALSGNTGVSTGPHIHFEILIGGSQVNPLKYIGQ